MKSDPPQGTDARVLACAASQRALADDMSTLTDDQVRRPSLLPGWSVGHVVTHLCRNADAFARMIDGARRGEVVAMYPNGREGRAADIEAGADRCAAEIIADLTSAMARLDDAFSQCTELGWSGAGLTVVGEIRIVDMPARRRAEVEIHRVDLGLGYTVADWPDDFVRAELDRLRGLWASRQPMGLAQLPRAALVLTPNERLAWLAGRLVVDGLHPAGVL